MLDLVRDILTRLSLKGSLYFRSNFSEPWGIRVPQFQNVARFHYVNNGEALMRVAGSKTGISLSKGDLILIPHGNEHIMSCHFSGPDDALPLEDVLIQSGFDGRGALVWGGGQIQRDTQIISGHFAFAPGSRHPLLDRLPPYIHLAGYGDTAGPWLEATLRVISEETGGARLGGDLIALKMSEAIFAQAIRTYIEQSAADPKGISGFVDPYLSRALSAFHAAPASQWTVATLAAKAGLSRTGFAERFAKMLGMTPMQYVTS
jgi:AraC family transcriptional activator of mtrCDE